MEYSFSLSTTVAVLSLSKTLNSNSSSACLFSRPHRHFSTARPAQLLRHPLGRVLSTVSRRSPDHRLDLHYSSGSLGAVRLLRTPSECVSNSAASFASGGGGFGGNDGSGGGRGGDGDGGNAPPGAVAGGGADDASVLSSDVIILDVGGMTCGGCAASVKRILESQSQVLSASVNLTTETAIVWPVSEAKVLPNWHKQLGEALAEHLTSCGFKSNLRGEGAIEGDVSS